MARALAAAKRHYGEAADAFRQELKGHYEIKFQAPDESALAQAGQLRGEVCPQQLQPQRLRARVLYHVSVYLTFDAHSSKLGRLSSAAKKWSSPVWARR
jgi:hypothetical protein